MWRWLGFAVLLMITLGALACTDPEINEPRADATQIVGHDTAIIDDPSTLCGSEGAEVLTDTTIKERLERAREVRLKYDDLLRRQPNVLEVRESYFPGGNVGIEVSVREFTNQKTLPPEDRLPGCLDGVPVRVIKPGPIELCGGCKETNEKRQ